MKYAENDILELFISKSCEMLVLWESYCLELEKEPSEDIFNELFRITHSLKGFAMNAGLSEFSLFVHNIEELVVYLIKNRISPTQEHTDLLLDCKDVLLRWTDEIRYDKTYVADVAGVEKLLNLAVAEDVSENSSLKRVLLVDLSSAYTENLKNLLSLNFAVEQVYSNEEAMREISKNPPHIVVTEIKAKDIDGIKLLHWVKNSCDIPVIAYSQLFLNELNIAKNMGAAEAIKKTGNIIEISSCIESLLKSVPQEKIN